MDGFSYQPAPPAPPPRRSEFDAFLGTEFTFRPLHTWPGPMTIERKYSIFGSKTTVGSTISLLRHELKMINAKQPMISMALRERDIRRDGLPRSDARPEHPGVIVSFDTEHGRLVYKCDTFRSWHANLRAIALTLEALRKPDRYGVLKAGEQYIGNRLLTAGGTTTTMGVRAAAEFLAKWGNEREPEEHSHADRNGAAAAMLTAYQVAEGFYRRAAQRLHPDAGGSAELMDLATKARETLRAHHGLGQ